MTTLETLRSILDADHVLTSGLDAYGSWIAPRIYDTVDAYGGSFSAEHGIGASKSREVARRKEEVALDLMQRIKLAFDPSHLMNPDRVLKAASYDAK